MKDDPVSSEQIQGIRRLAPKFFWTSQNYAKPPSHAYIVELSPGIISARDTGNRESIGFSTDRSNASIEILDGEATVKHRTDISDESKIYRTLEHIHNKAAKEHRSNFLLRRSLLLIITSVISVCSIVFFYSDIISWFRYFVSLSLLQLTTMLVLVGVGFFVVSQVAMAAFDGFRSSTVVRVKIGNGFFDFDPNMTDEELRSQIEEASSK